MPSDTLRFELTDGVALMTLNRPDAMNALNEELTGALMEALRRALRAPRDHAWLLPRPGRPAASAARDPTLARDGDAAERRPDRRRGSAPLRPRQPRRAAG